MTNRKQAQTCPRQTQIPRATTQAGSQTAKSGPNISLRWPEVSSEMAQDGPQESQGTKMAEKYKDCPKKEPKAAYDGSKMS
jgi:hypothetical protein